MDIVNRCITACLRHTLPRDSETRGKWFFDLTDQNAAISRLQRSFCSVATQALQEGLCGLRA
jgi:hypothetical protein